MSVLTDICWRIDEEVDFSTVKMVKEDDHLDITDDKMNEIPFKTIGKVILRVPTHRFNVKHQYIVILDNMTVSDILTLIYNFYNSSLYKSEVMKYPDDCLGIVQSIKYKINNNESCKWIDLMGDLKFFEGFAYSQKDNLWDLVLGS